MLDEKRNQTVFALFSDFPNSESAVKRLVRAGFEVEDISVLMPTTTDRGKLSYQKYSEAPEDYTTGATGGVFFRGHFAWPSVLGTLGFPGMGSFIAAGPLFSALAAVRIGGPVGGIASAIIRLGIPEFEAKRYEGYVKEGRVLLSVHSDDRHLSDRARRILKEAGAREIAVGVEEEHSRYFEKNSRTYTRADDYQMHK